MELNLRHLEQNKATWTTKFDEYEERLQHDKKKIPGADK